jgi:hypothetical protein
MSLQLIHSQVKHGLSLTPARPIFGTSILMVLVNGSLSTLLAKKVIQGLKVTQVSQDPQVVQWVPLVQSDHRDCLVFKVSKVRRVLVSLLKVN